MELNEALTRKMAHLARLELSDEEAREFTAQLAQILGYVESLQSADVTGVEPLRSPITLETPLRDDVARLWPATADGTPATLACGRDVIDDGFKVPPIL